MASNPYPTGGTVLHRLGMSVTAVAAELLRNERALVTPRPPGAIASLMLPVASCACQGLEPQPLIHQDLVTPALDHSACHTELPGDLSDRMTRLDQVRNRAAGTSRGTAL